MTEVTYSLTASEYSFFKMVQSNTTASELLYLKSFKDRSSINGNVVTIEGVEMYNSNVRSTAGLFDNTNTNRINEKASDGNGVNINEHVFKNNNVMFTTQIEPNDGSIGVTIAGINLKNSELSTNIIKPSTSSLGVIIDDINVTGSKIYADSIEVRNSDQIDVAGSTFSSGEIQTQTISRKYQEGVQIENSTFKDDDVTIKNLFIETISPHTGSSSFSLYGLNINDKTINDVTIDNGVISSNTVQTSTLSGINNNDIVFTGGVKFNNGTLSSGSDGFDIEGVFFKDSKIYVAEILKQTEDINKGIEIEGIELRDKILITEQLNTTTINATDIKVNSIHESDANVGVKIEELQFQNGNIYIPAQDSTDSNNPVYAKMYYKQEKNTIYFETPDGQVIIPPYVKNWDDWVTINTISGITMTTTHARYSVIDKGVWMSVDLTYDVTTLVTTTNKLWFTIPQDFKCSLDNFSNYTIIEKTQNGTTTYIPSKIFIDGNTSQIYCYVENLQENIQDNTTYRVQSNIFYEYVITSQQITSPWQAWYPVKRDNNITSINVISSRYYKLGTNMWINFDIGLIFNSNIGIDYKTTYLSLPSGVTSKSLIFSSPIIVIKSDTNEKFIGNINVGKRITDNMIDENTFRINLPEGFESGVEYLIQGQMIFEEVATESFDFFFDALNNWLTKTNNSFSSFGINYQSNEIDNKIKFIANDGSKLGSNWKNKVISDSKEFHFNSSNGIDIKKEITFFPYTYKTRSKKPWRIIKDEHSLHFQITMDGIRYMNQLVIYQ